MHFHNFHSARSGPEIPDEAMVKRGGNFDPANHGWEYFTLQTSQNGTKIVARGRDEVEHGTCFGCHSAARSYDFICESVHGCLALDITDDIAAFAAFLGCTDIRVFASSIAGGDGNLEFFIGARRG